MTYPSFPSQASGDPVPAPFTVLTVCTGNICRSPAVERLLTAALGPDSGVRVESAGVGAVVGAPVAPLMTALLDAVGVSYAGFAARQVTEEMVREADLVLALTRRHRSALVELAPAAVRRTFTVRELGRPVRGERRAGGPAVGAPKGPVPSDQGVVSPSLSTASGLAARYCSTEPARTAAMSASNCGLSRSTML